MCILSFSSSSILQIINLEPVSTNIAAKRAYDVRRIVSIQIGIKISNSKRLMNKPADMAADQYASTNTVDKKTPAVERIHTKNWKKDDVCM